MGLPNLPLRSGKVVQAKNETFFIPEFKENYRWGVRRSEG